MPNANIYFLKRISDFLNPSQKLFEYSVEKLPTTILVSAILSDSLTADPSKL